MKHTASSLSVLVFLNLACVQGIKAQAWQPVASQPAASKFTGLHVSKTSSALVIATLNNGIFRSADGGASWAAAALTKDSIYTLKALNEQVLYAGAKGAIFRSLDSGKTWTRFAFPHYVAIGCMAFHPSGKLLAGTGSYWDINSNGSGKGVWYSDDSAKTWHELNTGIPKVEPLIESIAIEPDGTVLAGIFDPSDFSNAPKNGVMYLESLNGSWQRASISVTGPSALSYSDNNLEIEHVYALNMHNNNVYASVSGAYTNFAVAFTISKSFADLKKTDVPWHVKWVKDSIASDGSFFELLSNVFQDSKGKQWASVATSSFTSNEIYQGQLATNTGWTLRLDGLRKTIGSYLFGEDGNGTLYTTDYFTGHTLYSRPLPDLVASLAPTNEYFARLSLAPNPVSDQIHLNWYGHSAGTVKLSLMNMVGQVLKEEEVLMQEKYTITLPSKTAPKGIYLLKVSEGSKSQSLRVSVSGE